MDDLIGGIIVAAFAKFFLFIFGVIAQVFAEGLVFLFFNSLGAAIRWVFFGMKKPYEYYFANENAYMNWNYVAGILGFIAMIVVLILLIKNIPPITPFFRVEYIPEAGETVKIGTAKNVGLILGRLSTLH